MSLNEYLLIDSGNFCKLEQIGKYKIIRPSPQAVWTPTNETIWEQFDAKYMRFSGGDGEWKFNRKMENELVVSLADINFAIEPTDFGHLGLFPEQSRNWALIRNLVLEQIKQTGECNVLNLFAYTGGSTLAAAQIGANVVHVDASKTSVAWAKKNAEINGLHNAPIRWIIDDVRKFVSRELRRGNKYHAIILDPPSFGRGNKGEVWQIEEHLNKLLEELRLLLSDNFKFFLLSAHSNGYTPAAMNNLLYKLFSQDGGKFIAEEMTIPETNGLRSLPSGAHCWFIRG